MRYWRAFMGAKRAATPALSISPARLADHADAPILLIHGKDDRVVPIDQSRKWSGRWAGPASRWSWSSSPRGPLVPA